MSAVNYGEVYGRILRDYGSDRARAAIDAVRPLPLSLMDATPQRALLAAEVKARYRLYYVDSFAMALAVECKAALVTSDAGFRRLGHAFPMVWLRT